MNVGFSLSFTLSTQTLLPEWAVWGKSIWLGKNQRMKSKLYLILTYSILMTTSAKCLHVILVHLQENFSDCMLNAIF